MDRVEFGKSESGHYYKFTYECDHGLKQSAQVGFFESGKQARTHAKAVEPRPWLDQPETPLMFTGFDRCHCTREES